MTPAISGTRNASITASATVERGAEARRVQRLADRADHRRAHRARVAEAQLGLGRMDVDVDLAGIDREEERHHRKAVAEDEIGIGGAHRAEQHLVAHRAAVDEVELAERIGARIGRQPREPRDDDAVPRQSPAARRCRRNRRPSPAPSRAASAPVAVDCAGQLTALRSRAVEHEMHLRVGHREALDDVGDRRGLGPLGLEELEPRRHRGEEVRAPRRSCPGSSPAAPARSCRRARPSSRSPLAASAGARRDRQIATPRRSRPAPRRESPACGYRRARRPASLLVACRSTERTRSPRSMPAPSSSIRIRLLPPPRGGDRDPRRAPASMAFSTSSLTTLAGRSTTSPAAMRLIRSVGQLADGQGRFSWAT